MLTVIDSPAIEVALPWWAVYTRHQHEKTAAETMTAKGLEVFLPLYTSVRRWKDRRKLLSLPLFPGYLFVRGALDQRLKVLTTPGVHMILSQGEQTATIPENEIEAIRRTVEGNCSVEPHPFLKCGQRVRVKCGSLSGVEGILIRKKNVFRLVLSVQMLAQSVSVEIDAADVEPLSAGANMPIVEQRFPVAQSQRYPIPSYTSQSTLSAEMLKRTAVGA
jgi:transcription antitermination factor NusG